MAAEVKTNLESERMAVIETRMETFVTTEKHERDYGDAKVMIAEIRGDIKDLRGDMSNLKWQLGVIVAVLSTAISLLVSRIPS